MIVNKIGSRMKFTRTRMNYSSKSTAGALGISPTVYSRYETGQRNPSLSVLMKFAKHFHVSIDFLLSDSDDFQTELYFSDLKTLVKDLVYLSKFLNDYSDLNGVEFGEGGRESFINMIQESQKRVVVVKKEIDIIIDNIITMEKETI